MLFSFYYLYAGDLGAQNRMNAGVFFNFVSLKNSAVLNVDCEKLTQIHLVFQSKWLCKITSAFGIQT